MSESVFSFGGKRVYRMVILGILGVRIWVFVRMQDNIQDVHFRYTDYQNPGFRSEARHNIQNVHCSYTECQNLCFRSETRHSVQDVYCRYTV